MQVVPRATLEYLGESVRNRMQSTVIENKMAIAADLVELKQH